MNILKSGIAGDKQSGNKKLVGMAAKCDNK